MAMFYRGAGVGTWWHDHDPRQAGFVARSSRSGPTVDQLLFHIGRSTAQSPFISLTRSYGVALAYARSGRRAPSSASPAYVFGIEIASAHDCVLMDPVAAIVATLPEPCAWNSFHHDGAQDVLIGLVDHRQAALVSTPVPYPPTSSGTVRGASISPQLEALVRCLRDAEVLCVGRVPQALICHRWEILGESLDGRGVMSSDDQGPGVAERPPAAYRVDGNADEVPMIDLTPVDAHIGPIAFVAAERPMRSPLVRIHYELDGKPQPLAHRLDLDKRIFLDPLEAGDMEQMRVVAARITDFLARH